jgi:hypothetical protein
VPPCHGLLDVRLAVGSFVRALTHSHKPLVNSIGLGAIIARLSAESPTPVKSGSAQSADEFLSRFVVEEVHYAEVTARGDAYVYGGIGKQKEDGIVTTGRVADSSDAVRVDIIERHQNIGSDHEVVGFLAEGSSSLK